MSKIDIDINETLDQLDELLKQDGIPAGVLVSEMADRQTVQLLKRVLEQDSKWRRTLMQTASDAAHGVPSAIAFLKDKESCLWMLALSAYLDEGGQV